jgi:hypothetical protein
MGNFGLLDRSTNATAVPYTGGSRISVENATALSLCNQRANAEDTDPAESRFCGLHDD